MLSPQALVKGLVSRVLPSFNFDSQNVDVALRQFSYGELGTMPLVRKTHVLADEGSYYVANNGQTGVAVNYNTAFTATAPALLIQNNLAAVGAVGPRVYLDYISLTSIVAGACTTAVGYTAAALVLDNVNRYTSGGSQLTPTNPNMAAPVIPGVGVYFGAIVSPAASAAARTIAGIRNVRPGVSSTVINVVGDNIVFNHGGVEAANAGSVTVANASLVPVPMPPIVLGPGHSLLLYLFYPVLTAPSAATYAPEVGFWVR